MDAYRTGETVLVVFPFLDQEGAKRRPALILLDVGDRDVLAARLTSQQVQSPFDVPLQDWHAAGLLLPSTARLHKLATLDKLLVERRLGRLSDGDLVSVRETLANLWDGVLPQP